MMVETSRIKQEISDKALSLGFDQISFIKPLISPKVRQRFQDFCDQGLYGDMDWMERNKDKRLDPTILWQDLNSMIMLGINYGPKHNPLSRLEEPNLANISCYALNQDYHDVIKKNLKIFAGWIHTHFGVQVKVFIDTAPILEKPLAALSGIGWQGKHTNLVSKEYGSWLFLASIMTDMNLSADEAQQDHCGACSRCIDICPTKAITAAYQLNPQHCISYLTIEHKGAIPLEYRKAIGNRIYGCDDCLAICPWNKFAKQANESAFHARTELEHLQIKDLLKLEDASFRLLFRKNPIKRIGYIRFMRNLMIVAGNSKNGDLIKDIMPFQAFQDPIISEAASWAIAELSR